MVVWSGRDEIEECSEIIDVVSLAFSFCQCQQAQWGCTVVNAITQLDAGVGDTVGTSFVTLLLGYLQIMMFVEVCCEG